MVNKVRTIDFLPEIFRTHTNRQFLDATLDVLVSQPNLRRVQGFIGEKYGYGVEPTDQYVVEPTKARRDYQLDPAVIFLKPETQTAQDFINYSGVLNTIAGEGGDVSNAERLFQNEFYSWDPFVDYDKIVNYTQYYWLPSGPDAVPIFNGIVYDTLDYTVTADDGGYKFAEVPGTNPTLTLLRGGTYEFTVNPGFTPFWIQTVPGIGATTAERTITGVINNGTSSGNVQWIVPDKSTFVNDTVYYQSGTDPNSIGIINLIETNADNFIDVGDIVGRKNYVSPNGVKFTNGLKVEFTGNVFPTEYAGKEYYVAGVGTSIELLPVTNFIAAEIWGESLYVPITPEYITVSRQSRDYNAWTRANRWFHQDVINITQAALGYVTNNNTTLTRAQRPIIEYRGNLKLYNSGSVFLGFINLLDTTITDAFSQLEGKTTTEVGLIDGQFLYNGTRIVFTADTNPLVRQNVYVVRLVPSLTPGEDIINLVPDPDITVRDGGQVVVLYVAGVGQAGSTWWFRADGSQWFSGQKKIQLNQYPLYDIFDKNGYSLGDSTIYDGSSFGGCKLFSYAEGSGPNDPVLGFPIAYSSFESIGDILFTVNINADTFRYSIGEDVIVNDVNIGFVHYYPEETIWENQSGWIKAVGPSVQYQVFEFPLINEYNYSSSNVSIEVLAGGTGYQVGDKLKVSGADLGGSTPENDLNFTVESVSGGSITAVLNTSISGKTVAINDTFANLNVVTVSGVGSSAKVSVVIDGVGTTNFTCDVLAKINPDDTPWNPVIVYYNDNTLAETSYTVARNTSEHTTTITVPTGIGVKVTVLLLSSDVSSTAYYQTPNNLENNPFNTNITQVASGDIKNQYQTIFTNAPGVTGQLFGSNNIHDLGNVDNYGTAIIQNSASLVLPGLFLRKPEANIFKALQFNSEQYITYKSLLVDLATTSDYNNNTPAQNILDDIIYQISTTKNQESAFFWSDMVFSGNPYVVNTYDFNSSIGSATFSLSPEVWSPNLYSKASYRGIGVYLTRTVNFKKESIQLLKGIDYTVSTTPGVPSITINYSILAGDTITVKEYNQTYGSFCPNTPSKLGLYPIYVPAIVVPPNTNQQYILGHDGSLNKLYGTYTVDPITGLGVLDDFRDQVLFEFECRVYNNYKVEGAIPLQADDVIPGEFRTTGYSRQEVLDIYSKQFLNWVGANRLDYKTQYFRKTNKYTYNYNQSSNKVTGEVLQQGYWKGLYQWFYDTTDPAGAPWQMLGLENKPDWWDNHYGAAPYTSGNTYMWTDIANGYVWNDGNPYINEKRIRPYLLEVLPVDSFGELTNPFTTVVSNYNNLTFNTDWIVGDGAPVEDTYLTSSSWPYDLMRLLALTKPAKFFNLFADMDDYKYNTTLLTPGQFLFNERYHLDPRQLQVYGGGTAKHSYINWVVDYNYQRGSNGKDVVLTLLKNLDVRLVYNMAGFTAKNYLKFLVEKATPNSRNTSLLIPDENYAVLLYDNPAEEKITYSSVVVQKTTNGYALFGNSKDKNYFTVQVPKPGLFKQLKVRGTTVKVAQEFYPGRTTTIPYGTEVYSLQAVAQFLLSYGAYLTGQGVVFDNIENGVVYDWARMAQEFLAWSQDGWETGSVISLNPNARNFVVNRPGLVPQPLTIQGENFLLNENLLPIQNSDMCIDRQDEMLQIKVLSPADTVAYGNINLSSIEHAIVFDNFTSFNDTIYNLVTGLRQSRLLLQGYKTGDWNGFINTSGFILNENNIQEWRANTKYPKGIIVTFKNKYYTSIKLIEPAAKFSSEDWLETDYGQVKSGLLPNPSTEAYESLFYYDTTRANLENDADLLSFSLIGFRPREYMAAADLSDITQVNVYQNIIKAKGTKLLADSFRGAKFDQGQIDYLIQENWAIKNGEFGAILNNNFIEATLDQGKLKGNPTLIGFAPPDGIVAGVQQSVPINYLINWERPPLTPDFLPPKTGSYTLEAGIPGAGYVNLGDSKIQAYTFADLNDDPTNLQKLYRGDAVWIANYKNSWNVYTAASLANQVVGVQNNLNGTVTVLFENAHRLVKDDLICIINFDTRVNGFYVVKQVGTIYTIIIDLVLGQNIKNIDSVGTGFKLVSQRFEQASNAAVSTIPFSEWSARKIWVDYAPNGQWAVWGADTAYKQSTTVEQAELFGISVAQTPEIGKLVVDGAGNLYRYWGEGLTQTITGSGVGVGVQVKAAGIYAYVSSPDEGKVYVYQLNTFADYLDLHMTIDPTAQLSNVTGAIAVSQDNQWLYIADAISQKIALWGQNNLTLLYQHANTLLAGFVPSGSGWGASIATSVDGAKLIVGAPYETVGGIQEVGSVYVYNRRTQRFYGDGVTNTFTLATSAPNNFGDVYVDGLLQTNTVSISGTTVNVFIQDPTNPFVLIPPPDGSIITVNTATLQYAQGVRGANPRPGSWFGINVDTNRYGSDFVVGAPYEITTVAGTRGVEGSVYRYTNAGQRYGVVTTTISGSLTGTIFIDGYIVNYSGSVDDIRDAINTQTPTNIIATTSGTTLTITVKDDTPEVKYNIIDITGSFANLNALGLLPYKRTQIIRNRAGSDSGAFGYNVKMNEQDSLLVAAIEDRYVNPTTFDYTSDCVQNDTIFDNDATIWIDRFQEQGTVSLYDYLPAYNEGINNPGQYTFGQYVNTASIPNGVPAPKYGYGLSYVGGVIVVGAPNWSTSGGGIAIFTTNWTPEYPCQVNRPTTWYVDKTPLPVVDINAINNVSIYNSTTNTTLEYLDYIDPVQGKLLGAVETNIDFMESTDPAVYNLNGVAWTWDHLGDTWLDLTTVRLLNYHQPDLSYNAKNWGKAFPGSTADIYTWIESTTPPINYSGPGFPTNFDKYTTATTVDNSTNGLVTRYYFWVKNFNEIPSGKTLSPLICSAYILNPLNSGISYLAPITTNTVALYNSGDYIQTTTSVLHLGYGLVKGLDDKHTSWNLIRDGDAEDFLPGLPTILGNRPSSLYLKFIESFTGWDDSSNQVPDPRLPELAKYGTAFRPRQSMFINRLSALQNYVEYANDLLITLPIVEMRDLSFLEKSDITYNTNNYWQYVNWWAPGYSNDTKAVLEVANINDLQVITENQLLVSLGGTNIELEDGLIVKVSANTFGKSEYYVYSTTGAKWTRIGAENTTIQILPLTYSQYGWASEAWGLIWDKNPSQEIYWIIRWLNEQCYINDLSIERNRSLILMFNYIQSESLQDNNYLPWLNKTSLIDVNHRIRGLLPYKKYQRDNQEFLEGFLNEIKPYHVLIKDFIFSYDGLDVYNGNLTDFDLPAQYNSTLGSFQTPQLVYGTPTENNQYGLNSVVWDTTEYKQWFQNYGLQISATEYGITEVTQLTSTITSSATTIPVKSTWGLPATGVVRIGTEDISYDSADHLTNTLIGCIRGVNTTTPATHMADASVSIDVPAVIVYNTGRGYLEPPIITAYIDTTVWPEPREAAVLTPVMAGDRLIGITVENPGSGYAVTPEISIQASSVTETFTFANFNIVNNTIALSGHPFITGDSIYYMVGSASTAPAGLHGNTYYYVRAIDANTIALYETYEQAAMPLISPYAHISTSDGRVQLINQGSGSNHTISVVARANCFTTGQPVREFKVNIKFDRISYTVDEGLTSAAGRIDEFYKPTPSMPGKSLPQLMVGVEYPNNTFLSETFNDRYDWTNWDIYGFDGILEDPITETELSGPAFVGTPLSGPYDVVSDVFPAGYGPEELVPGWITDSVVITITSNDLVPDWNHTLTINKYGVQKVYNNSGNQGNPLEIDRWWYGTPGSDPTTDPLANTPLSTNTNTFAIFLRS